MSRRYVIYALLVISGANFLSYCDRQIVSALESELTKAFQLKASEFGELWTAFTFGYMVFAPLVGFLADRTVRPRILAVCILCWTMATLASGLATTKNHLYLARFLTGVGEAGCLVIGPAMISDYFMKEVRGRALSVFFLGMPLGGAMGYLLAAFIVTHPIVPSKATASANIQALPAATTDVAPMMGPSNREPQGYWDLLAAEDWRLAFFVAGIPGLALAALVWMLIDPPRGEPDTPGHKVRRHSYFELFQNRTLMLIILAQAFAVITLVPLLHFGVHFFETKNSMTKAQAILTLGVIALAAGTLGMALSGELGDRMARRVKGAYSLLAGIAYIIGWPWLMLGFTAQLRWLVIPALTVGAFCCFVCMPAVNTQIANCVAARHRAMAFALAAFVLHLGDAGAPYVFGRVNDQLEATAMAALDPGQPNYQQALRRVRSQARQTTFVGFSFSMLAAGACCFMAMRTARRDELAAFAEDHESDADTGP